MAKDPIIELQDKAAEPRFYVGVARRFVFRDGALVELRGLGLLWHRVKGLFRRGSRVVGGSITIGARVTKIDRENGVITLE